MMSAVMQLDPQVDAGKSAQPVPQGGRYSALDIVLGALAIVACAVSIAAGSGAVGWAGIGLALLMFAIAAIDARRFTIPDELSATAFALALVYAELQSVEWSFSPLLHAVVRGATLAVLFQLLRVSYVYLRGRPGLGFGDVKLAGVAGAWLDWPMIPVAFEIAALTALAAYLIRQWMHGRSVRAAALLPFGLFLAPAIWLAWLLEVALFGYGIGF